MGPATWRTLTIVIIGKVSRRGSMLFKEDFDDQEKSAEILGTIYSETIDFSRSGSIPKIFEKGDSPASPDLSPRPPEPVGKK